MKMNTEPVNNRCGLERDDFKAIVNGKQTDLYILRNALGNEVAITNYAIMQTLFRGTITSKMLSIHQNPI